MNVAINDYYNDKIAKYFALRIYMYSLDNKMGVPYEIAITSDKTTKEAIDYWVNLYEEQSGRELI